MKSNESVGEWEAGEFARLMPDSVDYLFEGISDFPAQVAGDVALNFVWIPGGVGW